MYIYNKITLINGLGWLISTALWKKYVLLRKNKNCSKKQDEIN